MNWADLPRAGHQRLNRLQNTNEFMLADAATGTVRTVWSIPTAPGSTSWTN
jgi:hypothetical protein